MNISGNRETKIVMIDFGPPTGALFLSPLEAKEFAEVVLKAADFAGLPAKAVMWESAKSGAGTISPWRLVEEGQ